MRVAGVKYNQVIKHETVKRMKVKGFDIPTITEMTGLKAEEIEKL